MPVRSDAYEIDTIDEMNLVIPCTAFHRSRHFELFRRYAFFIHQICDALTGYNYSLVHFVYNGSFSWLEHIFVRKHLRWLLERCSAHIVLSTWTGKQLLEKGGRRRSEMKAEKVDFFPTFSRFALLQASFSSYLQATGVQLTPPS